MKLITLIIICLVLILNGLDTSSSYGKSQIEEGFDGSLFKSLTESSSIPGYGQVKEEKIYEALFSDLFKEIMHVSFYLANTTENRWFIKNPFKKEYWGQKLKDLGGISIELVQELYRVNKTNRHVNWKSAILDPIFLQEEYTLNSNNKNTDELCLVEEGQGNVDMYTNTGKQYRSYYTVSKVAFSKDRRYALVKYSKHCAPLSGGEFLASFEFKNNKWNLIGYKVLSTF